MAEERVQKILARAGYGSRRASEELIMASRVKINGEIAVLGSKADPQRDTITVDNQIIAKEQAPVYIALNKPQGVLSEVSPDEPRQTVRDLVPVPGHMFIVGRLDLDSEGLILLTNDGELANRLTHPRFGHEKEYRVLVGTRPDEQQLEAWRHGVVLEDEHRTAPAQVRIEGLAGKGAWLRVILNEGRKRQIREMGRLTGMPVLRILRIRIGSLLLGDLRPGQWRMLQPEEVRTLRASQPNVAVQRSLRRQPRHTGQSSPRQKIQRDGDRNPTRRTDRSGPAKAESTHRSDRAETPPRDSSRHKSPSREDAHRPHSANKPNPSARPGSGARPAGTGRRQAPRPARGNSQRSNRNR